MTRTSADRMAAQEFPSAGELERVVPAAVRQRRLDAILAEPHRPHEHGLHEHRASIRPVVGPRRRLAPALLAVAVAAAVAIGAVVGVQSLSAPADPEPPAVSPSPACGTTHAPDAATLLNTLADCAAAHPPLREARYDYLHVRSLGSGFFEGGRGEELSTSETETWTAADGTGRTERRQPRGSSIEERHASELPRAEYPADPAALETFIRDREQRNRSEFAPAMEPNWFQMVEQIAVYSVVQPQVQAAALRMLATKPGITVDGPVTDGTGRPGVAISIPEEYSGGPARHVLIIDPATGWILGSEIIVLEAQSDVLLVGPPPAVAWSQLILGSGRVDSPTERP
ncbi:CU044_5270 family protein [Pseudonocardia sp. TRM90224]|uniref:CU044_5270 family protein n=1 Tax=Pseudonocardia sp. TRM90224 TaxID=2812678 RepID=UPI001E41C751|nr:CU044_5270 family protein [Pseudonocardia sp. TRM90224]